MLQRYKFVLNPQWRLSNNSHTDLTDLTDSYQLPILLGAECYFCVTGTCPLSRYYIISLSHPCCKYTTFLQNYLEGIIKKAIFAARLQ